jgi:Putative zinc-finger
MGARHVDALFSLAYDGRLDDTARRRYDEHLAGCPQCAAAEAEFRTTVDAVRALPAARMPVRVVLPATPPVAERRRWWGALALPRVPALGPRWGAAAMAAVGIAAVVVAVRVHPGGGGTPATAPRALSLDAGVQGHAAKATTGCPLPLLVTSATPGIASGDRPAGFSNRVSVRNPQRPGQELVLATTSNHYAPGSQVLVFAALTVSSGNHRAVVPCVALEPEVPVALKVTSGAGAAGADAQSVASPSHQAITGASPPAPAAAAGGTSFAINGAPLSREQALAFAPYALEVPLAVAVPTTQTIGDTLPVQVITIPYDIPKGTVLRLVALVPAGSPGDADRPAVEAVLTLDVS